MPVALRDNVIVEPQKLLNAGIIEQVDASPWVSYLVVARKKTVGLRPCVDLRQMNMAVFPDKNPLPTVEELSAEFYGSTIFSKLDLRATSGSGHKLLRLFRWSERLQAYNYTTQLAKIMLW